MYRNRHGSKGRAAVSNRDEQHSAILKALGDETRMRLVRLLAREELNVQELCEILDMAQPKISRHLSVLRAAGLVSDHREGSRVFYSLSELAPDLALVADYVKGIAAQGHPDGERLEAVMRRRTRQSRDFARARASEWDELGGELHSSTAALLALAHLAPPGLRVADLGAGTGLMLPFLASFASRLYAVDHAQEMLDYARRRCRECQLGNVEFLCGDLLELRTLLPEPCDCMLLHFVLHQIARPALVLGAVREALAAGGRVVIVDRTHHEDESARAKFGSLWLGFEKEKILAWLRQAGLGDLRYQLVRAPGAAPADAAIFVASARREA